MTRPLRIEFPGAVYHIMSRGDRRHDIFCDDVDRRCFLHILAKEVLQQRWRLYAYCLMGNHYHLLVETPDANLVVGMRRLNGVYTQTFNRRHGLVGHVLQGRYKSIVVEKDAYLLELARYVVLNPVRAGLVAHVQDWIWSSYRASAGTVPAQEWLAVDSLIASFGDDARLARRAYREFVSDGVRMPSPWTALRGQVYLGGERFLASMQELATMQVIEGVPWRQRYPARPSADAVLDSVAQAFGVDTRVVQDRGDQPAYQAWVYRMRRATNLSLREAAQRAGVSPGRVSQIQRALDGRAPSPELAGLLEEYKVWA